MSRIASGRSSSLRVTVTSAQPATSPIPMPPITLTTKSPAAWEALNVPAVSAPSATRKATSALASLSIASPSTSRPTRSGTCMRLNVAWAAIGSVGATMAPSTNAAGQLNPSISSCETTATAVIVASTSVSTSALSGRHSAFSSRGEA